MNLDSIIERLKQVENPDATLAAVITDLESHMEDMPLYRLHAYRANGADYCRGCLMDSSDSDYEVITAGTEQELVEAWAKFIHHDQTSGREYNDYEYHLYHYGMELGNSFDGLNCATDEYADLFSKAKAIADDWEAHQKRLEEERKEKERLRQLANKEQQERDNLKALIKKYGIPAETDL